MLSFKFPSETAGKCPKVIPRPECPPPVSQCSVDEECPGVQKCCDDSCGGTQCYNPGKHFFKNLSSWHSVIYKS